MAGRADRGGEGEGEGGRSELKFDLQTGRQS